jgi:hypothetical protein
VLIDSKPTRTDLRNDPKIKATEISDLTRYP